MAQVGELYSFTFLQVENFKVKVISNNVAQQNASVQITSILGSYVSMTDNQGFSEEIFLNQSQSLTINVTLITGETETVTYNYTYDSNITVLEIPVTVPPRLVDKDKSKFNFYRFLTAQNVVLQNNKLGSENDSGVFTAIDSVLSLLPCDDYDFPNNYRRGKNKVYKPTFFQQDQISFIINYAVAFENDFADTRLGIVNNEGDLVYSNPSINKVDCNGFFQYYLDFMFPVIPNNENYFYIIYNQVSGVVYDISFPFIVNNYFHKNDYPLISYRNSTNIFNYSYSCLSNIRNVIRLDANLIDQQPEIELKQYREQTTGKLRNQKAYSNKTIKIETMFFDDHANDSMLALSIHDDIKINDMEL